MHCFWTTLAILALAATQVSAGGHREQGPPPEPLTPVPSTVSDEAQEYYRNWRPRPPGKLDMADPKQAAFMRKMLGRMFVRNVEAAGLAYALEAAAAKAAQAFWIRVPEVDPDGRRVLLYLHGGGYVLGSARTNLVAPIRVSRAAKMPVISVEYRLAPEHPFPAGLDDAFAIYRWLLDKGYEAATIGVFGDSAGGGLTMALALKIRDAGMPQPGALVAISPAVDLTGQGDTQATLVAADIVLGPPDPQQRKLYAGSTPLSDPLVSPVNADLTGLAPLLIQVGTRERLLSDSVRLARNARRDGVDVTLDVWEGMWHVWHEHPVLPEADDATAAIGTFFETHLVPVRVGQGSHR